jgi:RimJ/RimL family protein N-acetyltransferase
VYVFVETQRLILRRLSESDADDLEALDADPEVMALISGGVATPRAEVEASVRGFIADYARFHGLGRYAAVDKDSGAFLGWMSLRNDGSDEVDLGYRLHRSAWGHGFATEGARALIAKAFTEDFGGRRSPILRVRADTMAINTRSRAVMERAGLHYVRTFHLHFDDPIPGTELGEVEYAVTRAEWLQLT